MRPKATNGKCSNCGVSENMILARDKTVYSPCTYSKGKWHPQYDNTEDSVADDAVRFYCASCGTPHQVPEELQ